LLQVEPVPQSQDSGADSQSNEKAMPGDETVRKASRISISSAVNTPPQASSSRKPSLNHEWVEASMITCRFVFEVLFMSLTVCIGFFGIGD
jgi:hypothetical protein